MRKFFAIQSWLKKVRVSSPVPSVTTTSVMLRRRRSPGLDFSGREVADATRASTVTCSPTVSDARSVSSPRSAYRRG